VLTDSFKALAVRRVTKIKANGHRVDRVTRDDLGAVDYDTLACNDVSTPRPLRRAYIPKGERDNAPGIPTMQDIAGNARIYLLPSLRPHCRNDLLDLTRKV